MYMVVVYHFIVIYSGYRAGEVIHYTSDGGVGGGGGGGGWDSLSRFFARF